MMTSRPTSGIAEHIRCHWGGGVKCGSFFGKIIGGRKGRGSMCVRAGGGGGREKTSSIFLTLFMESNAYFV